MWKISVAETLIFCNICTLECVHVRIYVMHACMYAFIHIYIYIYIYIYICVCVCVWVCACMYVMRTCLHVCLCAWLLAHMSVIDVCILCMLARMYICVCV